MKKYLLLFSCSMLVIGTAQALTANQQLNAMKEIFLNEFNQMDKNKDGKISQSEYMSYQFENFRSNVMAATDFDNIKSDKGEKSSDTKTDVELGGISPALQEMAEYSVELDGDNVEIDLSVSEEESLKDMLEEMEEKEEKEQPKAEVPTKTPEEIEARNKQINLMMDTIKKTLPKEIDDSTTWTDILYENSTISYIYQVNFDISKFSDADKTAMQEFIKNQACVDAYKDMCPKIKTMFIDEGINVKIRYIDKKNTELNFCEFNKETCQEYKETEPKK